MSGKRFSGKIDASRDVPHTAEGLRMQAALEAFGASLPLGTTQSAPRTPEHKQQDRRSCFYASLVAARLAITHGVGPSERSIIAQAEQEGLLGPLGAETFSEFYDPQTAFIGRVLGLQVRFIDQRFDDERIDALTRGLRNDGQPVIFGTVRHWLVLDGVKRTGNSAWIGMDPASGRRLEDTGRGLTPAFLAARLVDSGMPTVVVEGLRQSRPRFQPTRQEVPRFRGTN